MTSGIHLELEDISNPSHLTLKCHEIMFMAIKTNLRTR